MLNARLSADGTGKRHSQSTSSKKRYCTTSSQVATFFLKKHATSEIIEQTLSNITRFVQPSNMILNQYAEELMTKILWSGDVYEEYTLNEIFIEGLDASIRHSVRESWKNKKNANLHELAFHATSLLGCKDMM